MVDKRSVRAADSRQAGASEEEGLQPVTTGMASRKSRESKLGMGEWYTTRYRRVSVEAGASSDIDVRASVRMSVFVELAFKNPS